MVAMERGFILAIYEGEIVTRRTGLSRIAKGNTMMLLADDIMPGYMIDGDKGGNATRFLNVSVCDPFPSLMLTWFTFARTDPTRIAFLEAHQRQIGDCRDVSIAMITHLQLCSDPCIGIQDHQEGPCARRAHSRLWRNVLDGQRKGSARVECSSS